MYGSHIWTASHTISDDHGRVRYGAATLVSPSFPGAGGVFKLLSVMEGGHNKSVRLGRNSQGPVSKCFQKLRPPAVSHKLSGAFGGVSNSEALPHVLSGHHALVKIKNIIMVPYINHQSS